MSTVPPTRPLPRRYGFGPFTLDTRSRIFCRGDVPISLSPKEFQTLLLLVEADGHALERDTMIAAIWPNLVVGDTSLGRNISVLRKHLGSDAIKAVSKFGYRFTLPVQLLAAPAGDGRRAVETRVEADVTGAAPEQVLQAEGKADGVSAPEQMTAGEREGNPTVVQPPSQPVHLRPAVRRLPWALAGLALLSAATLWPVMNRHAGSSAGPAASAARWDTEGMFALREGTYFKASKAFQQAIRLEPQSPMLHAHLAWAWLELDLLEPAHGELLLAGDPSRVHSLSATDQRYLNAIRATAVRDFPTAVAEYRAILDESPPSERADRLEDLGRAQQRAGDLSAAIASYREAATLQSGNAGVQLRLGLLESLQRNRTAAYQYLDRAAELYAASSNVEGAAEVSYQRGNMAYVQADYAEAEKRYRASMDDALRLSDAQLQGRAWGALSTVQRWDGKLAESESSARKEIEISRTAGWDFGYADGVMHLANVAIARKDRAQAKTLLQQSLALAQNLHHARLEANAEFSMADLAEQEGDYVGEWKAAKRAETGYGSYGSVDGVEDSKLLVVGAEYGAGHLPEALHDAQELLQLAQRTQSEVFVEDTEEELGDIYTAMNDLPTALTHYQRAVEMSHKTGSQPDLKSMGLATCLARMGRVTEAAALMKALPASAKVDPDYQHRYAEARTALAMAQGRYAEALQVAQQAATHAAPVAAVCFTEMAAEAEIKLKRTAEASRDASQLIQIATETHNDFRLQRAQALAGQASR